MFAELLSKEKSTDRVTLSFLGSAISKSVSLVSNYCNGKAIPPPRDAFLLARALGCDEKVFVAACLQDMLERDGMKLKVDLRWKAGGKDEALKAAGTGCDVQGSKACN